MRSFFKKTKRRIEKAGEKETNPFELSVDSDGNIILIDNVLQETVLFRRD